MAAGASRAGGERPGAARDAAARRRGPGRRPPTPSRSTAQTAPDHARGRSSAADGGRVELPDWERKVAGALAFLRRRLTGDYEVDEFGFDPELTEKVLLAALRPLYEHYFRVEARGLENIPSEGGALVVANHSGTIPLDSVMTQIALLDHHPARRHLRMLGADLVFQTAGRQRAGPQERHHAGVQRRRRAAARPGRARRRLAGGLQGHRQAVLASATSCSASAAAVSCRPRCKAQVPIVPVLDRRRRGDLPDARQRQDAGPAARPAVRAGHADLPVARAAGR